jgi:tetratricopeptide (TPR) repeat protein
MNRPTAYYVGVLAASMLSGCVMATDPQAMQREWLRATYAGKPERADSIAATMERRAVESSGPDSVQTLEARLTIVASLADVGRLDDARAKATEVRRQWEALHGPDDPRVAPALLFETRVALAGRQWDEARRLLARLVALCPEGKRSHEGCTAGILLWDLVDALHDAGEFERAARFFPTAEQVGHAGSVELLLDEHFVRSRILRDGGLYEPALADLDRCLSFEREPYDRVPWTRVLHTDQGGQRQVLVSDRTGFFRSQAPPCLEPLADVSERIGRRDEAARHRRASQRYWAEGPEIEEGLLDSLAASFIPGTTNLEALHRAEALAWYRSRKGRSDDAIEAWSKVLAQIEAHPSQYGFYASWEHRHTHVRVLLDLAAEYAKQGRAADAERDYRRAIDRARANLVPNHAWHLDARAGLARTLSAAGRHADAEGAWADYLALAASIRGKGHADYAWGLAGLAAAQEAAGRTVDARSTRARAEAIWQTDSKRVGNGRATLDPRPPATASTGADLASQRP